MRSSTGGRQLIRPGSVSGVGGWRLTEPGRQPEGRDEMRKARMRTADEPVAETEPVHNPRRIRANGWPVLPLRLFLAGLFCFAGYAKFSYPGFFDADSRNGFYSAVNAASDGTPLSAVMGPLADNPSLFGHATAISEIAIGLGLLVGLLARIAALGGMILTAMLVLSVNWNGVKEYTGSSGWFTSVELALIAALSIFLLGGAGPLALDNLFIRARERQRARDEAEPSFRDSDIDDSRRRLQGEPVTAPSCHRAAAGGRRLLHRRSRRPGPSRPGPAQPGPRRPGPVRPPGPRRDQLPPRGPR